MQEFFFWKNKRNMFALCFLHLILIINWNQNIMLWLFFSDQFCFSSLIVEYWKFSGRTDQIHFWGTRIKVTHWRLNMSLALIRQWTIEIIPNICTLYPKKWTSNIIILTHCSIELNKWKRFFNWNYLLYSALQLTR